VLQVAELMLLSQIRESLEKTYTIRPDLWTEMADCVAISCNLAETTLGLKKLAAARLAGAQAPAPAVQDDAAEQAEPEADAEVGNAANSLCTAVWPSSAMNP
jgi:hypothetical protein